MIESFQILNYKSITDLKIELGRINVFIGENGSGKTTILEAISLGSAASQDKLDDEFLASRGIRNVEPRLMKSGFFEQLAGESIMVEFTNDEGKKLGYGLESGKMYNWEIKSKFIDVNFKQKIKKPLSKKDKEVLYEKIQNRILKLESDEVEAKIDDIINELTDEAVKARFKKVENDFTQGFDIQTFLIYAPENFFLRRFEEEGQIRPLGIRGEGLFSHLVFLMNENKEIFKEISDHLRLIGWFDELVIPADLNFSERKIHIKDKFIKHNIDYIDQRSTNEGFLYLLFYITLFLSDHTPKFFAIDNIDNSLNPKLCSELIKIIIKLSKQKNKQAILTTHNPAILDGLDLNDENQRLFIIYRNSDGITKAKRVMPPDEIAGIENVRLSEAFVRGYLGGLPQNF